MHRISMVSFNIIFYSYLIGAPNHLGKPCAKLCVECLRCMEVDVNYIDYVIMTLRHNLIHPVMRCVVLEKSVNLFCLMLLTCEMGILHCMVIEKIK